MNRAGGGPSGLAGIQLQPRLWESERESATNLFKQHSWAGLAHKSLSVEDLGESSRKKKANENRKTDWPFLSSLDPKQCAFSPTSSLEVLTPEVPRWQAGRGLAPQRQLPAACVTPGKPAPSPPRPLLWDMAAPNLLSCPKLFSFQGMHRKLPGKLFHEDSLLRFKKRRDFPAGPVVKNPTAKTGNRGSIPHGTGQRSLLAAVTKACAPRTGSLRLDKPRRSEAGAPRLESGPAHRGRRKARPAAKTGAAKNNT